MRRYFRLRPDAGRLLAAAGLTEAVIKERAGLTRFSLDRKAAGQRTRPATAYKVAVVYAAAVGGTEDDAMARLFEFVAE